MSVQLQTQRTSMSGCFLLKLILRPKPHDTSSTVSLETVGLKRFKQEFYRAQEGLSYQQHVIIKGITSSLHQSDNRLQAEPGNKMRERERDGAHKKKKDGAIFLSCC